MTNAQIAEIIRQVSKKVSDDVSDTVLSYTKHLQSVQERNEKSLTGISKRLDGILQQLKAITSALEGDTTVQPPWRKHLKGDRLAQVEAVYQFLLEHKKDGPAICNESNAVTHTFEPKPEGYPTLDHLRSYCYSVNMINYV